MDSIFESRPEQRASAKRSAKTIQGQGQHDQHGGRSPARVPARDVPSDRRIQQRVQRADRKDQTQQPETRKTDDDQNRTHELAHKFERQVFAKQMYENSRQTKNRDGYGFAPCQSPQNDEESQSANRIHECVNQPVEQMASERQTLLKRRRTDENRSHALDREPMRQCFIQSRSGEHQYAEQYPQQYVTAHERIAELTAQEAALLGAKQGRRLSYPDDRFCRSTRPFGDLSAR